MMLHEQNKIIINVNRYIKLIKKNSSYKIRLEIRTFIPPLATNGTE